jgi:hypothetical protein
MLFAQQAMTWEDVAALGLFLLFAAFVVWVASRATSRD